MPKYVASTVALTTSLLLATSAGAVAAVGSRPGAQQAPVVCGNAGDVKSVPVLIDGQLVGAAQVTWSADGTINKKVIVYSGHAPWVFVRVNPDKMAVWQLPPNPQKLRVQPYIKVDGGLSCYGYRNPYPGYVRVQPDRGSAGSALTVSGGEFLAGESVKVTYVTGLASPARVTLCKAVVAGTGTFSCAAHVPTADTGAPGSHDVTVVGATSGLRAKTPFVLT
jgi:hypothetical protein